MKILFATVMVCGVFCLNSTAQAFDYVGSEQCFGCHAQQFNDWQASGHSGIIRKAAKARHASLPLPQGYSWEDISYVIGGVNKKARFVDLNGYIITAAKDGAEAKTQYNLSDGSLAFYHKGEKKAFDCGPCHTTGYNKNGRQDGRPGVVGTWAEDGIGCEECHGPGDEHIRQPLKQNIKIDPSAVSCGKCHQRGGINSKPPAKGGFIRHQEQINELLAGAHKDLNCKQCHNPHQRAVLVKDDCRQCHEKAATSFTKNVHALSGIKCRACHMPKASKSAIKSNDHTGDVRTHIFRIDIDPNASMFAKEEVVGKKTTYARGFITLDFACLGCHMSRDLMWASREAKKIHQ